MTKNASSTDTPSQTKLKVLHLHNWVHWNKHLRTVLKTYGEAGDEIYDGKKRDKKEPMQSTHVMVQVRNYHTNRVTDTVESWDIDPARNAANLKIAKSEWTAAEKEYKTFKSKLWLDLMSSVSEDIKKKLHANQTRWIKIESTCNTYSLYKLLEDITTRAISENAQPIMKAWLALKWERESEPFTDYITENESLLEQLKKAGKDPIDRDKVFQMKEAMKGINESLITTVMLPALTKSADDPAFPKYATLRDEMMLTEEKNPDVVNLVMKRVGKGKRKLEADEETPNKTNQQPGSSLKDSQASLQKTASGDFQTFAVNFEKFVNTLTGSAQSHSGGNTATPGGRGGQNGRGGGRGDKRAGRGGRGRGGRASDNASTKKVCWGCGATDHAKKHCKNVQVCETCGKRHATKFHDQVEAFKAKMDNNKAAGEEQKPKAASNAIIAGEKDTIALFKEICSSNFLNNYMVRCEDPPEDESSTPADTPSPIVTATSATGSCTEGVCAAATEVEVDVEAEAPISAKSAQVHTPADEHGHTDEHGYFQPAQSQADNYDDDYEDRHVVTAEDAGTAAEEKGLKPYKNVRMRTSEFNWKCLPAGLSIVMQARNDATINTFYHSLGQSDTWRGWNALPDLMDEVCHTEFLSPYHTEEFSEDEGRRQYEAEDKAVNFEEEREALLGGNPFDPSMRVIACRMRTQQMTSWLKAYLRTKTVDLTRDMPNPELLPPHHRAVPESYLEQFWRDGHDGEDVHSREGRGCLLLGYYNSCVIYAGHKEKKLPRQRWPVDPKTGRPVTTPLMCGIYRETVSWAGWIPLYPAALSTYEMFRHFESELLLLRYNDLMRADFQYKSDHAMDDTHVPRLLMEMSLHQMMPEARKELILGLRRMIHFIEALGFVNGYLAPDHDYLSDGEERCISPDSSDREASSDSSDSSDSVGESDESETYLSPLKRKREVNDDDCSPEPHASVNMMTFHASGESAPEGVAREACRNLLYSLGPGASKRQRSQDGYVLGDSGSSFHVEQNCAWLDGDLIVNSEGIKVSCANGSNMPVTHFNNVTHLGLTVVAPTSTARIMSVGQLVIQGNKVSFGLEEFAHLPKIDGFPVGMCITHPRRAEPIYGFINQVFHFMVKACDYERILIYDDALEGQVNTAKVTVDIGNYNNTAASKYTAEQRRRADEACA